MTINDMPIDYQIEFGKAVCAALNYDNGAHHPKYIYLLLSEKLGLDCHHPSLIYGIPCNICGTMVIKNSII